MKAPFILCLTVSTVAASWFAFDCSRKLAERDSRITDLIRERDTARSLGMGSTQNTSPSETIPQPTAQDAAPFAKSKTTNIETEMPDHQKEGIDAVLETLQSIEDPRRREEFLDSVFRKASTMGVATVLEWVKRLPAVNRDSALLALHSEWSGESVARLPSPGSSSCDAPSNMA